LELFGDIFDAVVFAFREQLSSHAVQLEVELPAREGVASVDGAEPKAIGTDISRICVTFVGYCHRDE
jgi:hypothetical protein